MNLVPSRALLADPEGERRARVRRELLRELPGVHVAEAGARTRRSSGSSASPSTWRSCGTRRPRTRPCPSCSRSAGRSPCCSCTPRWRASTAGGRACDRRGRDLPRLRRRAARAASRIAPRVGPNQSGRSLPQSDGCARSSGSPPSSGRAPSGSPSAPRTTAALRREQSLPRVARREREETLGRRGRSRGSSRARARRRSRGRGAGVGKPGPSPASVRFRTKSGEAIRDSSRCSRIRLDGASAPCRCSTTSPRCGAPRTSGIGCSRASAGRGPRPRPPWTSWESHERLESLSRRLVDMQEAERRALARELHDEVGQILASLRLRLEGGTDQAAAEVQAILGELLDRVRGLSMDLRPPTLDELGLLPTLLWHFERYQAETGVRVEFRSRGGRASLRRRCGDGCVPHRAGGPHERGPPRPRRRGRGEPRGDCRGPRAAGRGPWLRLRARDGHIRGLGGPRRHAGAGTSAGGPRTDRVVAGTRAPGRGRAAGLPPARTRLMEPVRIVLADDHEMVRQGVRLSCGRRPISMWWARRGTASPPWRWSSA